MALFNYATKEITLKIVYYGPGLSGKTTNIEYLHSTFDPKRRGKLLSLSTEADRTLFFDFLPIEIGKIKDFSIRFQLYTVPGQVRYNSTRKLVLRGADAVVFVADSQKEMRDANTESWENMKENLIENDLDIEEIPVVFQFNKRDLPNVLSIDELNKALNTRGYNHFESVAIKGNGVQEAFQAITKQLIKNIAKKHRIDIETKDLKPGTTPAEAPAATAIPELSPGEKVPTLETIHAEVSEDMEIEDVIEAGPAIPSLEEEAALDKVPSLEDLQREMSRELDSKESEEAGSILSSSQEMGESEVDEKLDLINTEFDETSSEALQDIQDQDEVTIHSTMREIEPETPSDDKSIFTEELAESVGEEKKEETMSQDDSIESIYKAFMSEEEKGLSDSPPIKAKEIPPPKGKPVPEIDESIFSQAESSVGPEKSVLPTFESFEEPAPVVKDTEADALKAFGDSITPSLETPKKSHGETAAHTPKPQAAMPEATKNVILDEINSLSKVVNKINSSISSFKSELNILSDKILDMDKRLSELRTQSDEMQESIHNGSDSGAQLTSKTLQTIMELKNTIDKARKRKFWLFFS